MPYYRFKPGDILNNRIRVFPKFSFSFYDTRVYYNNRPQLTGSHGQVNVDHVGLGDLSLYEMNIDRLSGELVYPFVTKDSSMSSLKTISTTTFSEFVYSDKITGSYPLSASVTKEYYGAGISRNYVDALKNTLDYYKTLSPHYEYSSSAVVGQPSGDGISKGTQELGLLCVPSIFYGSSIKKGTLDLKFYITGTLVGQLNDLYKNGELIQVGPPGSVGSGSVAGVALYNEGFLVLTGSWDLRGATGDFPGATLKYKHGVADTSKWVHFGVDASSSMASHPAGTLPSASFTMDYEGVNYIPTLTMFAHAPKGKINHSNNPTYILETQSASVADPNETTTSPLRYVEGKKIQIKNVVSSAYDNYEEPFEKHTFISKVGIFDKDKNLIAIAKLARPVKKTEDREYTFKLKLDI